MAWQEGSWLQDDSVNNGLPYACGTAVSELDFTNVTVTWIFTTPLPIHKNCTYIDTIDFSDIALIFEVGNENYGFPYPRSVQTITNKGSFYGCSNLTSVSIPPSVSFIDYYAFQGTDISAVTIAPDCFYYPQSLPTGCTISYYPATIHRIDFANGDVGSPTMYVGDDPWEVFFEADIILRIMDGAAITDRKTTRFKISGFDTSTEVEGATGTLTVDSLDQTVTMTKTVTYNVIPAPTLLLGNNVDPNDPEEPDEPEEPNDSSMR